MPTQQQSQTQSPHSDVVGGYLSGLTPEHRKDIERQARRALDEAGLSFDAFGDARGDRSGWRFDLAPMVIQQDDWRVLADGGFATEAKLMLRLMMLLLHLLRLPP